MKRRKIFVSLIMAVVLTVAVGVPASASTIVTRNDRIAYGVGVIKSSGNVYFAGGVRRNDASISESKVKAFINNLGDGILASFGYHGEDYSKVDITDKSLPYTLVKYYFTKLQPGLGSSKPVIYRSKDASQYLIAFQDAGGKNIVKAVSLDSNNALSVTEKSVQSVKARIDSAK